MTEWQDISTAPKDGTWFIAYRGAAKFGTWDRVIVAKWDDEIGDFVWPNQPFDIFVDDMNEKDSRGHYVVTPYEAGGTFRGWMPLPPPPKPSTPNSTDT